MTHFSLYAFKIFSLFWPSVVWTMMCPDRDLCVCLDGIRETLGSALMFFNKFGRIPAISLFLPPLSLLTSSGTPVTCAGFLDIVPQVSFINLSFHQTFTLFQIRLFLLLLFHFHWFFLLLYNSHLSPFSIYFSYCNFCFRISIGYFFIVPLSLLRFPICGAIVLIFLFNSLNIVSIIVWIFVAALMFLSAKLNIWAHSQSFSTDYFPLYPEYGHTCFCKDIFFIENWIF